MAKVPVDPAIARWPTERKYRYAAAKVIQDGMSQTRAAAEVGISRPRFTKWFNEHRAEVEAELVAQPVVNPVPLVGAEKRRIPPPDEFYEHYFGHWQCPDCGVHHPDPDFHREMRRAVRGGSKRVLINLPPYHSKSTEVSVKDTIYDIVEDPNSRTILVSKSESMAKTFLVSIKELLTNRDLYLPGRNLIDDYGPFAPTGLRQEGWTTTSIFVQGRVTPEKDATVQVLGVGQQIYGRRADTIKFDDIATLENQRNPQRVVEMLEWIDKEALSRIGRNGKVVWVGTRVAPGDIYQTLARREGYEVLKYPAILDEEDELMLWPDHFTFADAKLRRGEMKDADWALVYQQLEVGGVSQDFTQDALDAAKDPERVAGQHSREWVMVAGLDLAGGTKDSGYTSAVLVGIDLETQRRYLVDAWNVKSMRPRELKDRILEWSDAYPIREWRVEKNGLQNQIVQYNDEIIHALAARGVKVEPHQTGGNKWDMEFGVASMSPLFTNNMVSIPWGTPESRTKFQPLIEQLLQFPYGAISDMAMALWFADLGIRVAARRKRLPYFQSRRVPQRVAKRRTIIRREDGVAEVIPLEEQRLAMLGRTRSGRRRPLMEVGAGGIPVDYEGPDPESL